MIELNLIVYESIREFNLDSFFIPAPLTLRLNHANIISFLVYQMLIGSKYFWENGKGRSRRKGNLFGHFFCSASLFKVAKLGLEL